LCGSIIGERQVLPGIKPFVFAQNCNLGIGAAGGDDVILVFDDHSEDDTGVHRTLRTSDSRLSAT
jgi:hypothetical protein